MGTEKIPYIGKFQGKKVGVVGDAMVDEMLYGRLRKNPDGPNLPDVFMVEETEHRLGGAANTAANLCSLGADVTLYTVLGSNSPRTTYDRYGQIVRDLCKSQQIEIVSSAEAGFKTAIKRREYVLVNGEDSARYHHRSDDEMVRPITDISTRVLRSILTHDLNAVVFSDYNKGVFQGNLAAALIGSLRFKKVATIAAPKADNIAGFRGADIICVNYKEACEIVGVKNPMVLGEDGRERLLYLEELIRKVAGCTGTDGIMRETVVTLGNLGSMALSGGKFHYIQTRAADKSKGDSVGAGDSFLAGLSLALASGAQLEEACGIANCAAGIVVEKVGTSTVSLEELAVRLGRRDLPARARTLASRV